MRVPARVHGPVQSPRQSFPLLYDSTMNTRQNAKARLSHETLASNRASKCALSKRHNVNAGLFIRNTGPMAIKLRKVRV